jgi:hypothetical protein
VRSRFPFVVEHQDTCEVKRLCHALDVNRSSCVMWFDGAEGLARVRSDREGGK